MLSDNVYDGPVVTITCADETITATAYHPFWVCRGDFLDERQTPRELKEHEDEGFSLQGRWVNSHELRAGDTLIDATGNRRLIERLEQHYDPEFPVSNLTIQIHHTFAVGTQSILVHNTSGTVKNGIKFDTSNRVGKYLSGNWHKGTFPNKLQSVKYHLAKHGKGRTALQYTKDAMDFFNKNKHLGTEVILKDGTAGIKIQTSVIDPITGLAKKVGGYWTQNGRLVTFWD